MHVICMHAIACVNIACVTYAYVSFMSNSVPACTTIAVCIIALYPAYMRVNNSTFSCVITVGHICDLHACLLVLSWLYAIGNPTQLP